MGGIQKMTNREYMLNYELILFVDYYAAMECENPYMYCICQK